MQSIDDYPFVTSTLKDNTSIPRYCYTYPKLDQRLEQAQQQDTVTESFLQKQVCEKQGWSKENYQKGRISVALDAGYLKGEIDNIKQKNTQKSTGNIL